MWNDVRTAFADALQRSLNVRAHYGAKLDFKHAFVHDIFISGLHQEKVLCEQKLKKRGDWHLFTAKKGAGVDILCEILGLEELPVKEQGDFSVKILSVREFGFNRRRCLMRLRGTVAPTMM